MKKFIIALLLGLAAQLARANEAGSVYELASRWKDQDNGTLQMSQLGGRPQVVAMFFSHCAYACPRIVADLKRIESELGRAGITNVGFTLVSFDTDRDLPARLKSVAAEKGIDRPPWKLLHGSADDTRELAAALDVRYRREADGNFSHANVITVLDAEGRIAYRLEGLGEDPAEMLKAIAALR